jgi:chaperonin cofactor prefoldin
MPTVDTLQTEVRDLKRRLELTETRVTQLEGRFEFVSGQLRDIQLYMHAKFGDIDARFDRVDARFDKVEARLDRVDARLDRIETTQQAMKADMVGMNAKIDALPRVLAEMLAKR